MNKDKDILFGYILHYNPYNSKWSAIKREDKDKYFNGELDNVISSDDVNKLIELVIKSK